MPQRMNEWMRGEHKFFVVFGAAVYGPSSSGVDYTDFEEKDWEREKFLYVLHHLRPYNRERERSFVWEN